MDPSSSRLRPVTDMSPGDWVTAGVGSFGSGVGALVPRGFESYARILHPAESSEGEPVTWAAVAEWSGGTVHSRAQFAPMSRPRWETRGENGDLTGQGSGDEGGRGPAPWDEEPRAGELPSATLAALCEVLARHTSTPQRCWFCLWDGHGWINGSTAMAVLTASTNTDTDTGEGPTSGSGAPVPPAFPPEVLDGPRVHLPGRDYFLLEGPLDAALELGHLIGEDFFDPQTPNLFWPDDHAWCVATEIDLDSTYVGGPAALVADLLADPRLEAWQVDLADPVWADSDDINGRRPS
ncbi:MAG: hypothetical protein JWN52_4742 [Actinomycetia bacterium]|nr:hypothetical protein [Actinomycetes bacterium]